MNELDQYLMPITVADISLGENFQAYKMDSTDEHKNMRKDVGLGTCNSCDYFRFHCGYIQLIEETRLIETIYQLKKKFKGLQDEVEREKLIYDSIYREIRLKAYGSLLILCRLAAQYESANSLIERKRVVFQFLVSGVENRDDWRFFDSLKTNIHNDLKSMLTGEIVADVEILDPEKFKSEFNVESC